MQTNGRFVCRGFSRVPFSFSFPPRGNQHPHRVQQGQSRHNRKTASSVNGTKNIVKTESPDCISVWNEHEETSSKTLENAVALILLAMREIQCGQETMRENWEPARKERKRIRGILESPLERKKQSQTMSPELDAIDYLVPSIKMVSTTAFPPAFVASRHRHACCSLAWFDTAALCRHCVSLQGQTAPKDPGQLDSPSSFIYTINQKGAWGDKTIRALTEPFDLKNSSSSFSDDTDHTFFSSFTSLFQFNKFFSISSMRAWMTTPMQD